MSDEQTPVEGKGDEMIPERGLPFEEEPMPEEVEELMQDASTSSSVDEILEQVPPEVLEEPPVEEVVPVEANIEAPLDAPISAEFAGSQPLLDVNEIRLREQELAEDFNALPPDFDGELDGDAARLPVALPSADREAIMLESGAGIIKEEELETEPEFEEPSAEPETPPTPPAGLVKTEVVTQSVTTDEAGKTTEKETRVVRQEALFRDESIEPGPGPSSGNKVEKAPDIVRDLKASKKLLDLLVPNERIEALWKRADTLQQQVFHEINDLGIAQELLEQVRSAKNLILSDKANYEEAERALNEVEYRVVFGKRFKTWSFLGYFLLFYEIIWGAVASTAIYLLLRAGEAGLGIQANGLLSSGEVFIGILAALFGCIGGVAGALFALWRYMTEQRFNPQFSIWYITQPMIGLTVGIVIYIILKIGLNITAGSASTEVGSPLVPCLLAYLVGFQQNVFLDLAKQVFKQFKIGGNKQEAGGAG